MELAREIRDIKVELQMPIRDPDREEEILLRNRKFRRVFEAILEVSRGVQSL